MALPRPITALVCSVLAACGLAATAEAYAPVDHPGPPLDVPAAALKSALQCSPGIDHAARAPVLLVPGTGASAKDNFSWNYEPAFDARGIPWCALTFPADGNNDIQLNGEYVVYAIRTMAARAGRRIAIIGHSQGGMVPRWALRWWPDTRSMVDDVIGFAGTNHGTTMAHANCPRGCIPADAQQASDSQFIKALNSGQETFPGISYTEVFTHFDEEVQPNQEGDSTSSLHGGGGSITNVSVQDICPSDTVEHLGIGTYDSAAYALASDALDHAGAADPSRVSRRVCSQPLMPGIDPVTFPANSARAAFDVETSSGDTVTREPPLACYVFAACPSGPQGTPPSRAPTGCADPRHLALALHAPAHTRVVAVTVYLDGRRIRHRHARRLRSVRLHGLPDHGVHVLRIVVRSSNGSKRVTFRHYRGCGQLKRRARHHH
jgi:triacylglycerol esterase/lipase EstA (alpha/beta hydrolase family)